MKKSLILILKISVTVVVLVFLLQQIKEDRDGFQSSINLFHSNFHIIALVIFLMPLNWLMEVLKWKYSVSPIANISIKTATVGVLSGVALGFVTPHAIGDYFAKVFSLTHQDRKRALGLILVSRTTQMLPTLMFGFIAFFIYSNQSLDRLTNSFEMSYPVGSFLIVILFVISTILFLNRNHPKVQHYLSPIKKMSIKLLSILAGLSLLRYLIFSTQFLLLLSILNLKMSVFLQFMGIAFMFLAKTILPTFNFLSDLGIREFSVALFFEAMGAEVVPVITSGLVLWLINIAFPAFVGLFFIPQLKLKST